MCGKSIFFQFPTLSSCLKYFLKQYIGGTPIIAHWKHFGTVCVTASSLSLQPDLGIIRPNFRGFFGFELYRVHCID